MLKRDIFFLFHYPLQSKHSNLKRNKPSKPFLIRDIEYIFVRINILSRQSGQRKNTFSCSLISKYRATVYGYDISVKEFINLTSDSHEDIYSINNSISTYCIVQYLLSTLKKRYNYLKSGFELLRHE